MMKDYSNFLSDKPFSCDVEGCSMKFTNEDHLTVHKERHDMILNLGLAQKGAPFTDQTPTPTQFIRNCEEVGLFQDLLNVNPFEETFKKAAEAVKSGQPLLLEKPFQSNQPDDTLHTPNIFPHITDVGNINHSGNCNKTDNIPQCEDELLLKPEISESENLCDNTTDNNADQTAANQTETENTLSPNNLKCTDSKFSRDSKVILNVSKDHLVHLVRSENSQSSCNMVVIKNPASDVFPSLPLTVKEKLKKSLSEKKNGKCLQPKVPILKCPSKRTSNSLSNKFAKFSKNAMKLISKLENSTESEISEILSRRPKKSDKFQSKGSRSDFLARKRAASYRCREKKKMYIIYLEKVNSELSTANQNLELINSLLRKEICELRNELIKHRHCNAADKNTEALLSMPASSVTKKAAETEKRTNPKPPPQRRLSSVNKVSTSPAVVSTPPPEELITSDSSVSYPDPNALSLDVAEVILDDQPDEKEIPLNEGNRHPDIIVRFNSVANDFPARLPPDFHLGRYIQGAGEKVKQIYSEHCYFLNKPTYPHVDIDKRIVNYKTFREAIATVSQITSDDCKKLDSLQIQMKKNDTLRDLTSLKTKVTIGPRTPPPLILLKPFKKRSLQSKQIEKT